jgi:hypothetical protein
MRFALAVAGLALLVSCTGTQEASSPSAQSSSSTIAPSVTASNQTITDSASFVDALEEAGHTVRQGGAVDLAGVEGLASSGRKVFIDGVDVWALEYPTTDVYNKVRSNISKDGGEIGNAQIFWSPHIYGTGRLIVVAFGPARTLRTLDELLGPQFAGV